MDGIVISSISSCAVIVASVAYTYGRLSQKVHDMDQRVRRIETKIDGTYSPTTNPPPAT